ncbi:bifunctional phosphopantothenoylcysteine decarboxylase/phosphopantothenate--cysteine ligase CoaBC [Aliarcobacter trophiarum LMG 25534]|uniref:Coenzyme A biosynthesis bifunctional protein CoaBC n=1 Tax=Aliarcobacter trophiarum LMG 25534 TaxID=1032241 RepID=A0AAD0QPC8_9BACT|nr:bifunctional phosphopantothenoylcysteine decarboxylase/phosphopantothenate--cysteine ligase CoaBC [Aliarcobacter trophiarum]AXK49625.1 phosphopantothenoylcysteine decarboxylase/phosphopantothenate--cysteine ligase [Aliarcobacter trophiarum LMG 25534]RXI27459.1 bifunctional phosphopantothenoylcysteine decarboxylase/phosphopantothenate--cysteine ligase CoaBC [Aliarcobacter trophiarum]RXJ92295.1 bifunctional phosphopantothenoylcysteine decarboxylase/phosphopantothenate--cysteine ligase CoaBC [Al
MILKDKNILIGVTGSIAIYKTLDLIRLYIKAGASVRVIMSESAKKFINPITFEAISQNKILDEDSENWDKTSDYNHIDIGKWADILVVAPASANTINKMAVGITDNLLLQTVLAFKKEIIVAPAANTNMIENHITKNSLERLSSCGFKVLKTQTKELVCKDVGNGAMLEPIDIFYKTCRELLKEDFWKDRKVVISGGGTVEKIDDVRYISNFSSGKMAKSLALALYYLGADISLVASRGYENIPFEVDLKVVKTTLEFKEDLEKALKSSMVKKPFLFMAAAISDYIPKIKSSGKIKKDSLGDIWDLKLEKNIDILASLNKQSIISIGFKAEMDRENAKTNAKNMLKNKNLNGVCLNILDENNTFGSDTNTVELILNNKSFDFSGEKLDISLKLLEVLQKEFTNE